MLYIRLGPDKDISFILMRRVVQILDGAEVEKLEKSLIYP